MKRILALLPALLVVGFAGASIRVEFPISGKVIDQEKKPVPFAVVTLLNALDSTLVKGAITDDAGSYFFESLDSGKYILAVSFTGYSKTWEGPFDFVTNQILVVPDITMTPSKDMEEVTISAIQPLYVRRADMLIMNVENSPVRIIGNAWDLLSTVPGVIADQNGKITLHGKSGVLIYMDGKNTFLGGDQLMNYLQGISAADVTQIQIISNPSAKYDAQGSGGILNVLTRKGSQQGFNGAIRVGYGQAFYSKYEGGMNFNYAKEKFNIYGRYDISNRKNLSRAYINRNIAYNGSTTNYNQHNSTISNPLGQNARLGIDFYAKHNITWGGRVDGSFSIDNSNAINSTLISAIGNDTVAELYQENTVQENFQNVAANLYFKQQYDTNGRELSASMDYITYSIGNNQTFDLNYFDQSGNIIDPEELQRSNTLSGLNILVGQVDYSHPFNKKYKMELGIKSSYVETQNDLQFDVFNNNSWENDSSRSNEFIYKEQINAAYVTGYADYGKLQIMAGLRAEQTNSDGNSPTTGEHLKRTYVQLFPSVFILKQLNKNHALNLTYSRRVNRPGYNNLNPFNYYLDKYTYEKGNPFLQPEISNNVEFTYSFMDALFVTIAGGRTNNAMTDITEQIDSTGVGYKTTVNLNTVDNAYFGISTPIPVGKWLLVELEIGESYSRYTSDLNGTPYDNKNWAFNAGSHFRFSLPHDFKFESWAWYNGPATYGIFRSKSQGGVGCSVSKSFLSKQLSFTLAAYDIFHTNGMRSNINFQNQDMYLEFIPETPRVTLRARYIFGNTKATRKAQDKSGADDLKDRTGK